VPESPLSLQRCATGSKRMQAVDEAFRDLLKKHRRPVTLKEMVRESAPSHPANDHAPAPRRRKAPSARPLLRLSRSASFPSGSRASTISRLSGSHAA
jgi:hypothetical protein